ncbi:MAG: serine aminopeptidase domain-containing protein [Promethearchaeota archaeon]
MFILISFGMYSFYLAFFGTAFVKAEEVYFNPSKIDNWQQKDESFLLHGKLFYPFSMIGSIGKKSNYMPHVVILMHGLNRDLNDNIFLINKLLKLNIVCFTFSFRGHGLSGGDYPVERNSTFSDTLGAYRFLYENNLINPNDFSNLISYGISMGGANALFCSLKNLSAGFILSFPAIGYYWNDKPLYMYNLSKSMQKGVIMAGTNDECSACAPQFVETFFNNNNCSVELIWFQGATHTDSNFWFQSIDIAFNWIREYWQLPSMYSNLAFYILFAIGVCAICFSIICPYILKKKQVEQEIDWNRFTKGIRK